MSTLTEASRRLVWGCERCRQPIEDGDGYLELMAGATRDYQARRAAWEEAHPIPDGVSCWAVSNLRGCPRPARWLAWHSDCDPAPHATSEYWIAIEQIRTVEGLLSRTAHLLGKKWIGLTDWRNVVQRQSR